MNIAILIAALINVESCGNDSAVGDGGKALGCLQLHEIFVADANRIMGTNYTPDDRYDRDKSIAMATGWITHYADCYEEATGEDVTVEVMARIFNGGFRGYFRNESATDEYWAKVDKEMRCLSKTGLDE